MRKKILSTGIFVLDTIMVRDYPEGYENQRVYTERKVLEEVGGTCGNVTTMLSHLGQDVYPVVHLDDSPNGMKITSDLKRYGCNTRFVTNDPEGGTTHYGFVHKRTKDGTRKMSKAGGDRFPKHRHLRASDQAPAFLEALDFTPDVFFFDAPEAGYRLIAESLRQKGTLVYFEPEHMKETKYLKSIELSDIIKFSGERVPDTSFTDQYTDKLFIQTMGSNGIRFKLRDNDWIALPPVINDDFVDYEGAGDWTSAMTIHWLCENDKMSVDSLTVEDVKAALQQAQQMASKSVSYFGSKGIIHGLKG